MSTDSHQTRAKRVIDAPASEYHPIFRLLQSEVLSEACYLRMKALLSRPTVSKSHIFSTTTLAVNTYRQLPTGVVPAGQDAILPLHEQLVLPCESLFRQQIACTSPEPKRTTTTKAMAMEAMDNCMLLLEKRLAIKKLGVV